MPRKRKMVTSKMTLVLKLRLKGMHPPVWRDVAIAGDATLADLHFCIQEAFDWDGYHLHNFTIGRGRDVEFLPKAALQNSWGVAYDEAEYSAYEVLQQTAKLLYTYDFGDDWKVEVVPKGFHKGDFMPPFQVLKVKGKENPPEDCGGIPGFSELLYYWNHPEECDDEMKEQLEFYFGE